MATYKTPGVFIEEIVKFPPSVAPVATAVPAFIGFTKMARRKKANDLRNVPTRITSLLEYTSLFGETLNETTITVDATGPAVVAEIASPSDHNMYYSLQAYFANGGGPCYIVSVGEMSATAGTVTRTLLNNGLTAIRKIDEITLIVFPEATSLVNTNQINDDNDETNPYADYGTLMNDALTQCNDLKDRFVIMDAILLVEQTDDQNNTIIVPLDKTVEEFRSSGVGINNLKYGAAYGPALKTVFDYFYSEDQVNVTLPDVANPEKMDKMNPEKNDPPIRGDLYPLVKSAIADLPVTLPASPIMAGIYAAVDNSRGVWKAPANVSVNATSGPVLKINDSEQEDLNVTSSGKSINAIREFTGKGTLVWGARTLAGNDNEWRYVPVRRFFNFAEESIKKATEAFVFEPNDANTWTRVRAMIENFLLLQWRAGALAGAVPEDAFFVRVGLPETMTALDILEGRMNVEIGMAVVRPAEFIILKFSHKMQES